jgi:hypothetical protein
MDKRRRVIIILAAFLLITGANYWRISDEGHVRSVEFLSIFVMGALFGVLVNQLIALVKKHN